MFESFQQLGSKHTPTTQKKTEPTGDGSEILKPVEVGSLSPYLQGFTHIPGGAAFLPSTVCRLFERFMHIRAK